MVAIFITTCYILNQPSDTPPFPPLPPPFPLYPPLPPLSSCLSSSPVPYAVSNLKLENNNTQDSLRASWSQPQGDVDSIVVTLSSSGTTPLEKTLSSDTTKALFHQLTPGRTYQVSVATKSGELSNQSTASANTGDSRHNQENICKPGQSLCRGQENVLSLV